MAEPETITMYGHGRCPAVRPMKHFFKTADVKFQYVDILTDSKGMLRVREINDGNASVPTIIFPDGSTLTEPKPKALEDKLREVGYLIKPGDARRAYLATWVRNPLNWIVVAMIIFTLLRAVGVF
ncbi:hypothetical protein ACFLYP_00840 [Chloroflexota bacterium]